MDDSFTPDEAGRLLGIGPAAVRYWCRMGVLGHKPPGSQWRITPAELAQFRKKPRVPGRKAKSKTK